MGWYLIRRALGFVVVLWVMTAIVFALQAVVPADPARALAGPAAPAETVAALRTRLGLDDPVMVQYGRFLARLAEGDLGTSIRTRQPVTADIARYLPATLELVAAALIIGCALAVLLALAQQAGGRLGGAVRLGMLAAGSVPIFLGAMILVYLLWYQLGWLPGSGRTGIRRFAGPTGFMLLDGILLRRSEVVTSALAHLALPALTLALPVAVAVGRSLNAALGEVMQRPHIRTARGKGMAEPRVILRHGLRNAASAPLAMLGLQLGLLFGNLLIVERIFAWPGLGLYMVQSLGSSDLPATLGVALVFGALYILANLVIEILQSLADPRIAL